MIQCSASLLWPKNRVSHLQKMLVCLIFGCKFISTPKLFKIPYETQDPEQSNVPIREKIIVTTRIISYKVKILWLHCIAYSEHYSGLMNSKENKIIRSHMHAKLPSLLLTGGEWLSNCFCMWQVIATVWL